MTNEQLPEQASFLVADCGSMNTRVVLFDVVEGVYRFIAGANAPTTKEPPWSNIMKGIQHAITRISDITGRPLLDEHGQLITPVKSNGAGIDQFGATVSAAPALKCLLIGLVESISVDSSRATMLNTLADEVDFITLLNDDPDEELIQRIVDLSPDIIFIAGGTEHGADYRVLKMAEIASLATHMLAGINQPQIIYAGNSQLQPDIKDIFGAEVAVTFADNIRPTLNREELADASRHLTEIYNKRQLGRVGGIKDLNGWCRIPMQDTPTAFSKIVQYFAAQENSHVMGVDLGSESVTIIQASPEKLRLGIRSDLGVGRPIKNILNHATPYEIRKWIPAKVTDTDVRDFLYNKSLRPQTVPTTEESMQMEQACARAILNETRQSVLKHWYQNKKTSFPPFSRLLARGSALTNASRPVQTILMLLDALQPQGLFSVSLDTHGVLPALGLISQRQPLLAVQALEGGVLTDLGWVLAPATNLPPGEKIMSVKITTASIRDLDLDNVTQGSIEVIPIPPGQEATIDIQPVSSVDIGFGSGKGKKFRIQGGAVGLVIDGRGRPLNLPTDEEKRHEIISQWFWDTGA
ncbi:MAG TPA: glutamate mutase L [Anaerolineae bacterium]|nr:glutamate mutase L [Anaerolineae bacterium]